MAQRVPGQRDDGYAALAPLVGVAVDVHPFAPEQLGHHLVARPGP
jgi:hypothetical protein